ncbi:AI-2E family transporter [Halocatena pleomorpha]|uniref:AI-2E family transporter n=1 Tax=Halocatena pleomorpha TaxID=1785090 RepID=A0A3P3R8F8_9EURY|nr:AI-2E family transporter [Halocatena pleomorpha]
MKPPKERWKSSRAIECGCVRYGPLDLRLKTQVCARNCINRDRHSSRSQTTTRYGTINNGTSSSPTEAIPVNGFLNGDPSLRPWWALVIVLALTLIVIAHAFVGTIVFGIFFYYAMRPINRRIRRFTNARRLAAIITLILVFIPILSFLTYTFLIGLEGLNMILTDQVRQAINPYIDVSRLVEDPQKVLSLTDQLRRSRPLQGIISTSIEVVLTISNALIHLSMILAIVYYLLRDGARIKAWFREEVGTDSAAYAYASAVDRDLESVYFANVIAIVLITFGSIVWYNLYNAIAPAGVTIPVPTLLALLTGIASIIPIVVGKLVYVPIAAYLLILAGQTNEALLVYPALFVAVAFLFLDFIPQTFIQPYIAGRKIHVGLMIFAYVFGGLFFGWYGLFLGPIILVFSLQAIRLVVTDLLRGGPVTPRPTAARDLGSDPALDGDE